MRPDFPLKDRYTLGDIAALVHLLRDPVDGCPWDRVQTHESIRKNFLEEAYEACDAIDREDAALLQEELGDVLLQVALHAEMESEAGHFDLNDVADALCKKLIVRHPHIFGDASAADAGQALDNWEAIKRATKGQRAGSEAIDDVPKALPALYKCQKVQKRAHDAGFDYQTVSQPIDRLRDGVAALERAVSGQGDVDRAVGDVLFAAVSTARLCQVDAESSAAEACERFKIKFRAVEKMAGAEGRSIAECSPEQLRGYWNAAKEKE